MRAHERRWCAAQQVAAAAAAARPRRTRACKKSAFCGIALSCQSLFSTMMLLRRVLLLRGVLRRALRLLQQQLLFV